MAKLKSCPFCGGKAELFKHRSFGQPDYGSYSVACGTYDCIMSDGGSSYATKHEAIEAWNRRRKENGNELWQ
ncbi:MAG: Lar family restriction alleviation protein [Lachnospiraceae bacterium]|nr:Lar family restriction alleviation protein [Lachnospiraceae bacterium]